ncbi:MAG: hypothetical protein KJN66_09040 [Bacteroidia bacterium]|nr:hypothetical protein [Bacteroidia bacterium]
MKHILSILILLFSITLAAQSKEHSGIYTLKLGEGEHVETTKLTLNPNGTFLFHFYDYREKGIPKERIKYGKGVWTSKGKLIFLSTIAKDIDESHVLDFNNSKARFETKSPRDRSNRNIRTSIRFYESDIFWMVGRTYLKE